MRFGGFLKSSLIDYPEKVSCVVFLSGCNFGCPYCHNPELVRGQPSHPSELHEESIFDFLESRKPLLDGVVVTGGEPTLQPGIADFCAGIKTLGYHIKLDTNGSRPEVLNDLLERELVDFVAMDIKTDPNLYYPVFVDHYVSEDIMESIRLIMASAKSYEFRTTCARPLVSEDTIGAIVRLIHGAKRYCLQHFHQTTLLKPDFFPSPSEQGEDAYLDRLQSIAAPWVEDCIVR